jgi:2'-5' RNA ligase
MRLFTALLPPDRVLDGAGQLADEVARLRAMPDAGRLRWTERRTWHVTLAFYGEVDESLLDGLTVRLGRAAARAHPIRLRLAGGGRFGERALWAAVQELGEGAEEAEGAGSSGGAAAEHPVGGEALRRLAASIVAAGRRLGLGRDEPRRFHAHVTLARHRRDHVDLRPYAAALADFVGEPWTARELTLVRSHLPEHGVPGEHPRYEPIAAWPLGG